jgi:hypothetical protein
MVQYIHTPWRDRGELLKVRRQFYPSQPDTNTVASAAVLSAGTSTSISFKDDTTKASTETDQRHAVSRVAMWVQRGSCPHMVESTGLLMAAILDDLLVHEASSIGGGSTSAVRLAYSAAFSRYVFFLVHCASTLNFLFLSFLGAF